MNSDNTGPPAPSGRFWELLPRRNFRQASCSCSRRWSAIIAIKQMGGFSLEAFDGVAPRPRDAAGASASGTWKSRSVMTSSAEPMAWVGLRRRRAGHAGARPRASSTARRTSSARARRRVWSAIWIGVALLFNLGIYFRFGSDRALEFFQAWLIEKALSVDNLFVFLVAFSYFAVPAQPAAPGAVLGNHRRADHARPVHRHRRGAARALPLRHVHVRRVPDLHGRRA